MRFPGASVLDAASGRWSHTFRQSDVGTFRHCPEQFRLKQTTYYTDLPGRSTLLGTAVHAAIETAIRWAVAHDLPTVEESADLAVAELNLLLERHEARPDIPLGTAQTMARDIVTRWHDLVVPELDWNAEMLVEHQFHRTLWEDEYRTIAIQGTIDLVNGGAIWDWKTGARIPRSNAVASGRETVQHVVYSAAMAEDVTRPTHTFRYCYLPRTGGFQVTEVASTSMDVALLVRELLGMAHLAEATPETYPLRPTDWWCSDRYCPVWQDCRGSVTVADLYPRTRENSSE